MARQMKSFHLTSALAIVALATATVFAQEPPDPRPIDDSQKTDKADKPQKVKKPSNSKKNPDEIGNRDVGKGINFYSIEKEIALGKQLAQEVERQARIVDDPIIAEYVNRVGQNLVRNSD